jgi:hypothetical protein
VDTRGPLAPNNYRNKNIKGRSVTAGKKWLRNFFRRHPTLSLKKPQPTSAARIKVFTAENVATFFDFFEKEMGKNKIFAKSSVQL